MNNVATVMSQGIAIASCVKAKEFMKGKKLDNDLCSKDSECLMGLCY